jgi:hypothetical protein
MTASLYLEHRGDSSYKNTEAAVLYYLLAKSSLVLCTYSYSQVGISHQKYILKDLI